MHGAQNTSLNACILSTKNADAPVHARLCNGAETSLPWKRLRTCFESCASIVQAVVCRPPCYCLDEISRPTLFAQEIRPNPPMTRSPLRCRTRIIRSSTLVQASSSLSMVCTRNVATGLTSSKILFLPFFRTSFPQHHIFLQFHCNMTSHCNSDSVFSKDALLSHKRERKRTGIPLNPCLVGRGVVPTAR